MGYNRKTTVYLNPSVLDALGEAESVEELYAAWQQAVTEYKDASAKTRKRWRKYVERKADVLRTQLIVRPGGGA